MKGGLIAICAWVAVVAASPVLAQDRLAGLSDASGHGCSSQIGVFGNITTAVIDGAIYYRTGTGPWMKSAVANVGHSVAHLPNGNWIMNDTLGNRVVEFADISGKGRTIVRSELAGMKLNGPHDQIVDPNTGYIYVVDSNKHLFRFKDLELPAEVWAFTSAQLGYARALSWFDGHLHIIDSSRGEVLRIDDFSNHQFTLFRSPRPNHLPKLPNPAWGYGGMNYGEYDFPGGTLSTTGLIFDDVDKIGDWYYATNEFEELWANGSDPRPARLIRWRTWSDFEKGNWEDLSKYLDDTGRPYSGYFITVDGNILYTPMGPTFNGKIKTAVCRDGKVLRLDTSLIPR